MSWFKCKVCTEKDARIRELQEQVAYLKLLAIPENNPHQTPLLIREADSAISGTQELLQVPPEQLEEIEKLQEELDAVESEREKILTGHY